MSFVKKMIDVDPALCPKSGIITSESLGLLSEAQQVAERIRQRALKNASRIEEEANRLAQEKVRSIEAAASHRAAASIKQLQMQHHALLEGGEDLLLELVKAAIDKIMLQTSDHDKIRACIARVKAEAPPRLQNALLHVHPLDLPNIPPTDWQVIADSSLPTGSCRLEAEGGVWEMDFALAVDSVKSIVSGYQRRQGDD